MSLLRASPSLIPSPSSSPNIEYILNRTATSIYTSLRNSLPHHNMTTDESNMLLGDPNQSEIHLLTSKEIYNILSFMAIFAGIIGIIGFVILSFTGKIRINFQKENISICNPINWLTNKYKKYKTKHILPITRPKKAKESPFIGPDAMPNVLPSCVRLDGAEKGQNIMFRFRGQINARFETIDSNMLNETRITIVTVEKPPLAPKI